MRKFIVVLMMCLFGCDNSMKLTTEPATSFITPNGKKGATANCSGLNETINDCYLKVSMICTNGYTVLNENYSNIRVECK